MSFLQDIIKPPILPKILSDKDNSIKTVQIQYGNNKNRNKFLGSFVESIKYENTFLPDSLFDAKALNEIYKKQINNNEKKPLDNLSCAEILLNFLEFIIYYFKNDSVYVNCSIENEGYESMYYILNNNDPDKNEKKKIDERFQEYFKNKYFKCKKYNEEKITKDGFILIRDPIDPHYNPGQTLRNGDYIKFIDNLKMGYLKLLKGEINLLDINKK